MPQHGVGNFAAHPTKDFTALAHVRHTQMLVQLLVSGQFFLKPATGHSGALISDFLFVESDNVGDRSIFSVFVRKWLIKQ